MWKYSAPGEVRTHNLRIPQTLPARPMEWAFTAYKYGALTDCATGASRTCFQTFWLYSELYASSNARIIIRYLIFTDRLLTAVHLMLVWAFLRQQYGADCRQWRAQHKLVFLRTKVSLSHSDRTKSPVTRGAMPDSSCQREAKKIINYDMLWKKKNKN